MTALMILERDIIATGLEEHEALKELVGGRILWNYAVRDSKPKYPYVIFDYEWGGYNNDARGEDSDSYWKVCGRVDHIDQVAPMMSLIESALHREKPGNPNPDKCALLTWLELEEPWIRWVLTQNSTAWEAGGLYRIRLNLACKEDRDG